MANQEGAVMRRLILEFCLDRSGATALEYGFVAVLISIVVIASAQHMGVWAGATLNKVTNNLAS